MAGRTVRREHRVYLRPLSRPGFLHTDGDSEMLEAERGLLTHNDSQKKEKDRQY